MCLKKKRPSSVLPAAREVGGVAAILVRWSIAAAHRLRAAPPRALYSSMIRSLGEGFSSY